MDEKQFTAIDLLDKIIEFERRWPDQEEWNTSAIDPQDLSRLIRLQRIEALAKAFLPDLSKKLTVRRLMNCLLSNNNSDNVVILRQRHPDETGGISYTLNQYGWHNEYQTLAQDIIDAANTKKPGNHYNWRLIHLDNIYQDLLYYKKKLDHLFTPRSTYLEGTPAVTYGSDLAYDISKGIRNLLNEEFPQFHRLISRCIDPLEQTFNLDELIKNYGYPDFDLEDYELD